MYYIYINVGNFAVGKLKQRIEFSSKVSVLPRRRAGHTSYTIY